MKYYISLNNDNTIHCLSTTESQLADIVLKEFNTEVDLELNIENVIIITDNEGNFSGLNFKVRQWDDTDWQYRVFLPFAVYAQFVNQYFDAMQSLKTEPVNPQILTDDGVYIYINVIEENLKQLLESQNIAIEKREDIIN